MRKLALGGLLGLVALLAAAASLFLLLERKVAAPFRPGDETEIVFTVPKGATARALGPLLVEEGLIEDARLWRYHLFRRGELAAKAGRFRLRPSQSLAELATALEGSPLPEDEPFAVLEGWRLRDTDAALASRGLLSPGTYEQAARTPTKLRAPFALPAKSLEGYLYPETYGVVPESLVVEELLQRQLDTFVRRFYEPHRDEIEKSGRTLHELVIMASMLEREEPDPAQRPLVAGILWKRIDRGVPLGVDATSRYELPEWNDRRAFLKKLRDPRDPWNTRARAGLPPGPIGAPTVESLLAALRPKKSEYWYYLHDAERILRPSRSAKEHESLRKRYHVY